jgi:hypothetical protein
MHVVARKQYPPLSVPVSTGGPLSGVQSSAPERFSAKAPPMLSLPASSAPGAMVRDVWRSKFSPPQKAEVVPASLATSVIERAPLHVAIPAMRIFRLARWAHNRTTSACEVAASVSWTAAMNRTRSSTGLIALHGTGLASVASIRAAVRSVTRVVEPVSPGHPVCTRRRVGGTGSPIATGGRPARRTGC